MTTSTRYSPTLSTLPHELRQSILYLVLADLIQLESSDRQSYEGYITEWADELEACS